MIFLGEVISIKKNSVQWIDVSIGQTHGMNFDKNLLMTYKKLIQTTELERSYQEFLRLFRFLRVELEKELPDYRFQGNIVENGMDYSYFQFTNDTLKKKGLKIAVTSIHRNF